MGAVIASNSSEGQTFIDNEVIKGNTRLSEYGFNATNGEHYDIKDRGLGDNKPAEMTVEQYRYRGSVASDGKIGSARDFGNMAAGIVAARNGLMWEGARASCDGYQSFVSKSFVSEGKSTQLDQKEGFQIRVSLRKTISTRTPI